MSRDHDDEMTIKGRKYTALLNVAFGAIGVLRALDRVGWPQSMNVDVALLRTDVRILEEMIGWPCYLPHPVGAQCAHTIGERLSSHSLVEEDRATPLHPGECLALPKGKP